MLTRFARNCCACLFFILYAFFLLPQANAQTAPPLAEGQWHKIGITQEGVYRLDASFLKKNGIISSSTNPQHIRIYGQGGGMLPQPNSTARPDGLQENALYIPGEADGRFDSDDFILFYGQGPDYYQYLQDSAGFSYQKNLYSDTVFYFITVDDEKGKRMAQKPDLPVSQPLISQYTAVAALEEEKHNLLNSGRRWLGKRFGNGTAQSYPLPIHNVVAGTPLHTRSAFVSASTKPSSFELLINGALAQKVSLPTIKDPQANPYAEKGKLVEQESMLNTNQLASLDQLQLKLEYSGGSGSAYLDYVFVTATAHLRYQGEALFFRSTESLEHPEVRYSVSGATDELFIWNISNPQAPALQQFRLQGEKLSFGSTVAGLQEFVAFSLSDTKEPVSVRKIANQNLRADLSPEMVILTHPSLLAEAQRLAAFRQQQSGLRIKVVTTGQVYNEFSSGAQDITAIRDYMRYLYTNGNSLKYLLLFGRGYFDYKKRTEHEYNLVPVYESYNFTDPVASFVSDDFFGFLEEHEGEWSESEAGNHSIDIGIGRFPVVNATEARALVDKLIHYQASSATLGSWRNKIVFVADDEDGNIHQQDAEKLANIVQQNWPAGNISKIYLGAFAQQTVPNGERAPEAMGAINKAVEEGVLLLNYTGHGSENLLTNEYVITQSSIAGWKNQHRLPVVVTATCEFGQHDNTIRSGGETMLLHPTGGAIALLTTARPVYSHTNYTINSAFYQNVFPEEGQEAKRLGDIIRHTKNEGVPGTGVWNRNFILLGDPSMPLAFPRNTAQVSELSETGGSAADTVLSALKEVNVSGIISNTNNGLRNVNFNGVLEAVVYEKPLLYETIDSKSSVMEYSLQNDIIFRGQAKVEEGRFSFSFVVPKSIRYTIGNGKVSLYAVDSLSGTDAGGQYSNFYIGGSSSPSEADQKAPEITLFLNDSSFRNGDRVGKESILHAWFTDESGINITRNGPGEGIKASLDGKTTFLLNDYYMSEPGNYRRGSLQFPLQALSPGPHTLTITGRDTYNNMSKAEIRFVVSNQEEFDIYSLYNYPNPFRDRTAFVAEHSRAGESIEAVLSVYDMKGTLLFSQKTVVPHSLPAIRLPDWDGKINGGQKLPQGVYLFKVLLRSLSDGSTTEKTEKLVILN
ncbi:type IX secretion system sortase PorU [Nafulsella turpanensis]|uniref:type IX secretion system sortase PorU n=1 Tax=Nafulsella turpanensis TaxID=1265690 RepID=UPI0003470AA4|nr:type IX secretion system sortase PorU [Nafulsella turpanensis]